jgi:2-hydroxychromene-2-carboxylate isomerase
MKLAAKHGKNNGIEPVFCGNSIKINGNQPPDFQNNFKIRST